MGKCIIEINSSTVGSTGKIMFLIAAQARKSGYVVYTASAVHGNEKRIQDPFHIYIGNRLDKKLHLKMAYYTGLNGCFSEIITKKFIRTINKIKPDLIHIHNLHNCYINIELLFDYIRRKKIPVVWTLHDCWAYTGHCAYYSYLDCNKWINGCSDCPQIHNYPYSKVDKTSIIYGKKKKWFQNLRMTLVTPSEWLKNEVSVSFLKSYNINVINNGIDLNIFKPIDSQFKMNNKINEKFVILGVANSWAPRKGLDIFERLAVDLSANYQIVIVGLSNEQKAKLNPKILGITRTDSQQELVEIYSSADVFVNPTREDNFPTTNIEALACGTGVITFDTGGSAEMLTKETGIVVQKDNYNDLKDAIYVVKNKPFDRNKCRERALQYSCTDKFNEYVNLFDKITQGGEENCQ